MRVLFFGNNALGARALRWLCANGEDVVGVVLHPASRRRHMDEALAEPNLRPVPRLDGAALGAAATLAAIQALRADLGVSVLFGYRIPEQVLALLPQGAVNLHPGLLPHNRGAYPNVWSIVDRTPAGVTLHMIDDGLDTGDIIAQQPVAVEATDTGATLYARLETAGLELLQRAWPLVRGGRPPRAPQRRDAGTTHRQRDVERIDEIDLSRRYIAGELIDVLRARTFRPHAGAYFMHQGRRVFLRLELAYEPERAAAARPERPADDVRSTG
jgi:methionyl-tRNA formyltransferase